MKTFDPVLTTAIQNGTLATFVKVTTKQSDVYGFTDHDREVTINSVTYTPSPGLSRFVMALRNNIEVSNQEFTSAWVVDLPETDLAAGVFDDASIEVFKANWDESLSNYSPEAVDFSSVSAYLRRDTAFSVANSKQGLVSFWIRPAQVATNEQLFLISAGATDRVDLYQQADKIGFHAYTGSATDVFLFTTTSVLTVNEWTHVMFSWDAATSTYHVYINGSVASLTGDSITNATVDWTNTTNCLGYSSGLNYSPFTGEMSQFYATGEYLDLSSSANRAKLISGSGAGALPVDFGSDGSTVTGTQPYVFMNGVASVWNAGTNLGSGGDWTVLGGGIADSSNEPVYVYNPNEATVATVFAGKIGLVQWSSDGFRADVYDVMQDLAKPLGVQTTSKCRHNLFDASSNTRIGKCGVSSGSYTHTSTVAAVSVAKRTFTATSLSESDTWAANGILTFTSGNNSGLSFEVKKHTNGSPNDTFELFLPTAFTINAGDTFSVTAGCDKTFSTCQSKFSNGDNFGGFPHIQAETNYK